MHRRVVDLGGRLEAMRGQFDGAEVIAIHDDAPGVAFLTADGEFETELAAQPPLTTVVTGEAQAPARDILVEQFHALLGKMLDWLLFSIPSKPDMNGFIGTFRIVAGVTWTLPYEWLFYFCLPFLGVLLGNRPSPVAMAIMAGMIWLVLKAWQPNWTLAYMFVAGGLSALAVRSTHLQRFAASIPGNLLCLALLLLPGVLFPSAYQETAILILGLAFLLIAAGSSLFGLLTQALSRFLGEMTYSMYLLHGCILFISFELLIGRDNAKAFSALEHWLVIGAITPLVVLASYLSFRFIESPAMQRSRQLSALLGKPMLALKRLGRHPTAG